MTSYTHKKQSGGSGQFGKIDYRIKPGEPGSVMSSRHLLWAVTYPRNSSQLSRRASRHDEEGPSAGFPVLDVEIELYDGGFHAVDSSAIAFELAAKAPSVSRCPKRVLS